MVLSHRSEQCRWPWSGTYVHYMHLIANVLVRGLNANELAVVV